MTNQLTIDLALASGFIGLWLIGIPILRMLMPRIARGDEMGFRAILGESLLMLHVVILVIGMVGVIDSVWDLIET